MDVLVKGTDMKLGSTVGLTLWVSKPKGGQVGRLEMHKAKLRWFKGKSHVNAYEVTFDHFIQWLESQPTTKVG
jgi:hypothetical protein